MCTHAHKQIPGIIREMQIILHCPIFINCLIGPSGIPQVETEEALSNQCLTTGKILHTSTYRFC